MPCGRVISSLFLLLQALAKEVHFDEDGSHSLYIDVNGASTVRHQRHDGLSSPKTLSADNVSDSANTITKQTKARIRSETAHPIILAPYEGNPTLQRCICWLAVLMVIAAVVRLKMTKRSNDESLDALSAALLCAGYVSIAAASDVLVKWETQAHDGALPFAPARMVFLVEFLKLALTVPIVMARFAYNNIKWPSQAEALVAMRLMIVPAMAYSANNAIIYIVVSKVDFSSLSVWRQLTPLFVAFIWVLLFRRQLGSQRWFALALLVCGTALNSLGQHSGVRISAVMILVVLCSCLTTAVAGVANEYVLKRCGRLDIDFLCCLLYVQTSIISLSLAVACESHSVAALTGMTAPSQANSLLGGPTLLQEPRLMLIILLQVLFGFAVARVIRYLGSVPRAIVNAAKELTVVVIAPVFTDSHINATVISSGIVVGVAAALFTLAPSPLPTRKALNYAWSPCPNPAT